MSYDSEYYKDWNQKNWEKRKAYRRERIVCEECGANISRGTKYLHEKTKKHETVVENNRLWKEEKNKYLN